MAVTKEEINRKLLHVFSGTIIPAGIYYLPLIDGIARIVPTLILFGLFILFFLIDTGRRKSRIVQHLFYYIAGSMLRKEERAGSITGATWIFLSAFLCSVIFFRIPYISFMVLCMFILGDALAAIVGIQYGKIKIGKKSLEGSLACFSLSLVLMFWVFPSIPGLLTVWDNHVSFSLAFAAALSTTLFELFPIRLGRTVLNDNLVVPLITGVIIYYLHPVIG